MSLISSKTFRLKKNDRETTPDNSSDSPRKRTHTLSKLFKRRSNSFSSQNSESKKDSLKLPTINKRSSKTSFDNSSLARRGSTMSKSMSTPTGLSEQTTLDLSKSPQLPSVKSVKPRKTKLQELEAVRKKLIGAEGAHLPHILSKKSKNDDSDSDSEKDGEEELSDDTDSDEFKPSFAVTTDADNKSQTKRKSIGRKSHRPISSTPNASEDEDSNEPGVTQEHSGLFSTLMNTFNFKSATDLSQKRTEEADVDDTENPVASPAASTKSDILDSVSFIPIKKSLITTLGQGSLTLDSFPKNQTQLPMEEPENIVFDKSNNIKRLSQNETDIAPLQKNEANLPKSRTSKSVLSRKTMKSSLSSTFSEDEDGNTTQNAQSVPLIQSLSFKKKMKLPLSYKRQSTEYSLHSISSSPDDPTDANIPLIKKRDALFEKLEVKPPGDKRQDNFNQLFPNLPSDEILVDDFTCAYRKDILIHGKLYLTNHYICFHSNIIGMVTHLAIPLNSILKIQKRKTLGIPNAIEFSNLHNKYIFASFISRDQVYDLIHKVWRMNCINSNNSDLDVEEEELDSVYTDSINTTDDDDDEDDGESDPSDKRLSYSLSKQPTQNTSDTSFSDTENMVKDDGEENTDKKDDNTFNGIPMEGPKTHPETSIGYTIESGETKITDEVIKAPMGVVFSLLFGDDVTFMKNLLKVQKNFDIGDIPKFSNNKRVYRYVKPVNGGPVGPKQTKCIVEETIEKKDFDKYCLVVQSTESPDVPSGNSFKVRTKIFLSWAPNNSTRLFIVTMVVWTGKSWIKGAVERGAIYGQKDALATLVSELRKKIAAGGSADSKGKKSPKKSKEKIQEDVVEEPVEKEEIAAPPVEKSYLDIFMDQLDLKFILISILFVIVITDKFRSKPKNNGYELYTTDRMLMSESSLWEWIEQRERSSMNIDSIAASHRRTSLAEQAQNKMNKRELKDSIDIMEQQLSALKEKSAELEQSLL
ncbi:hypothetical protein CANINC_004578 [Pichia inconspicua]|uniref:VASt domain-containing protein n=1 Tax=Pichia inconspicua TaxID=52247 RepID=A0A4T0WVN6_9ASCO|nr:hypothetical protein CANINC_004578 [[Candida] inconspicua]